MANAQVVLVTTEGPRSGSPMRTVHCVAEENPIKAQAVIAKIMAPNEGGGKRRVPFIIGDCMASSSASKTYTQTAC